MLFIFAIVFMQAKDLVLFVFELYQKYAQSCSRSFYSVPNNIEIVPNQASLNEKIMKEKSGHNSLHRD